MSLQQLIEACIREEKQAQRNLFYQYAPILMGIVVRYVKDDAVAQDVVQESFIRIFKSMATLRNTDSPTVMSWMKKIAARESIRWIKKNQRYQFDQAEEVLNKMETSVNDELERADLLKLLQRLPSGYRATFNLYVIEGFSHKEIGDMLDISPSTSRSQLTRAKKQLQEWIKYDNEYVS